MAFAAPARQGLAAERSHDAFVRATLRARQGDLGEAGALVLEQLPYLMGAAYRIDPGGSQADREDMVSSAVTRLFELWRQGKGPDANPRSYLVTMMRNARTDALRAGGREREQSIEHAAEARPADFATVLDEDRVRRAELHREAALVRKALGTLSPRHQLLLQRVVVEGRKPAQLVEELGSPAPTISAALLRAKHALRRALLAELLRDGGEECARHAASLPKRVCDELDDHAPQERGMAHARGCEECRRNWRRFAALTAALGVLPLLVVAVRIDPVGVPASDGGAALRAGLRGRVAELLASSAVSVAAAVLFAVAGGSLLVQQLQGADRGGAAAAVAAAPRTVVEVDALPGAGAGDGAGLDDIRHRLDASVTRSGDRASIILDFAVLDAVPWRMQELSLVLPEGAVLVGAPQGWSCADGVPVRCTAVTDHPESGAFEVASGGGAVELSFTAQADGRAVLRGRAWGRI